MDTITVIARETLPYADRTYRAGQSFEATAEDARILTLIGKVDLAPIVSHETERECLPDSIDTSDQPAKRTRRMRATPDPA